MAALVEIFGGIQILVGILVYFVAKSAIHEILAAVMFGMGVLAFALGLLIEKMDQHLVLMHMQRKD